MIIIDFLLGLIGLALAIPTLLAFFVGYLVLMTIAAVLAFSGALLSRWSRLRWGRA